MKSTLKTLVHTGNPKTRILIIFFTLLYAMLYFEHHHYLNFSAYERRCISYCCRFAGYAFMYQFYEFRIDLIHNICHLCTRFRIDGLKQCQVVFQGANKRHQQNRDRITDGIIRSSDRIGSWIGS